MPVPPQGRPRGHRSRDRVAARSEARGGWQASFLIYLFTGLLIIALGTAAASYLPMS